MKLGKWFHALFTRRKNTPAQRVDNPYRKMYPDRARVDIEHPFRPREQKRDAPKAGFETKR